MVVVGDIGHGGPDPGCIVGEIREADYQLQIGLQWRELLTTRYAVEVLLTRETDRSVDSSFTGTRSGLWRELRARCDLANKHRAALLFSMHHNANGNPAVRGGEIYVYGAPDWAIATDSNHRAPISYRIACRMAPILSAFLASWDIPFRGVRVAGFDVLEYTAGPAVLVEPFYATNPADLAAAMQPEFQRGLVETYVKMVGLGLGLAERKPGPFWDVPSGHWAAESLTTAKELGIVDGLPGGSFGLGQALTREEGAVMAVRAYQAAIRHLNGRTPKGGVAE